MAAAPQATEIGGRREAIAAAIQRAGKDDIVLLVGHGLPVARFIEAWLLDQPGPSFRFVMENAAVNALRFARGTASLLCLNDVMHLAGMPCPLGSFFATGGGFRPGPPKSYW